MDIGQYLNTSVLGVAGFEMLKAICGESSLLEGAEKIIIEEALRIGLKGSKMGEEGPIHVAGVDLRRIGVYRGVSAGTAMAELVTEKGEKEGLALPKIPLKSAGRKSNAPYGKYMTIEEKLRRTPSRKPKDAEKGDGGSEWLLNIGSKGL